jgi:hypothetical protein
MSESRNRIVTDDWTLVLPEGWRQDREGAGFRYESADGTQRVIIDTFSPDPRYADHPAADLSAFEEIIRAANAKNLGENYAVTFAQRSSHGDYLVSTIAGFDGTDCMGICVRKYVGTALSILVQVHDYNCETPQEFEKFWRERLGGLEPMEGEV